MRSNLSRGSGIGARRAIVLAAMATLGITSQCAEAGVSNNGTFVGIAYDISTSGATALGAFTRGNNSSGGGTNYYRGPITLGSTTLTIGRTTYTLPPAGPQYLGIANTGIVNSAEPTSGSDRLTYWYRESGSVQGILDLADSNGLLVSSGGQNLRPGEPTANLFQWINGNRFTNSNQTVGGYSNGQNYTAPGVPAANPNGQPLVRIAWSDVRFEQAFANSSGTSNFGSRKPTEAGYGRGQGNIGGTNFQQLRDKDAIVGGIDPSTTKLRNQSVAAVPFNLVANPGTGLAQVTKDEGRWLQATGRLSNGANFNSVTREIGSGTRNQGCLNLGLDPSYGGGERDRRYLGTASFTTTDINGATVTIQAGDEMKPELNLFGGATATANENRVSPLARFSDKISGSSGVRATVVASRMGVGVLSGGDSRDASLGSALDAVKNTTGSPMRALKIDFGNGHGYLQATVDNVTSGKYEMWSAAQAVTVAPYAAPAFKEKQYLDANGLPTDVNTGNANPQYDPTKSWLPINGDTNDASGSPTSAAEVGVHRKFLDNLTGSVARWSDASSNNVPSDFIINAGYILPQIMKVSKQFDGSPQTAPRTLSTVDPDGAGPLLSEQATFDAVTASGGSGILYNQTNWADPSTMNGNIASLNGVTYKIFASANESGSPNRTIGINSRTNLAGDFNGDEVRDLGDVSAMALAYADPTTFVNTPASGDVNGRNYNGIALKSDIVDDAEEGTQIDERTSKGTNARATDGLIALSDFNSDGNVVVDANSASFDTVAVARKDVRYFLQGATVDTSAYNTGIDEAAKRKNRRENGVRFGALKKNAAIGTFNAAIDNLNLVANNVINPLTSAVYTPAEVADLKFSKYDVNGSDEPTAQSANGHKGLTIADAKYVNDAVQVNSDGQIGLRYDNFKDSVSTTLDLVAANLNDEDTIVTHIADGNGYSDFKDIRAALGSYLLDGDANFDRTVDSMDFGSLLANFGATGRKWSDGDFYGFDGKVNTLDFNALAGNFGMTAPAPGSLPGAALGSVVPEPASMSLLVLGAPALLRRRR